MEAIVDQRITAWYAVWDVLIKYNPNFVLGGCSGTESVLKEIRRLQEANSKLARLATIFQQGNVK